MSLPTQERPAPVDAATARAPLPPPPAASPSTPAAEAAPAAPTRTALVLAFTAIYLIWGSTYLGIRVTLESIARGLNASVGTIAAVRVMPNQPALIGDGMSVLVAAPLAKYLGASREGFVKAQKKAAEPLTP